MGKGDIERVKFLVSNGANVNAKNSDGLTPLHSAAFHGKKIGVEMVNFLLSAGADVNAKDGKGETPIDVATSRENHEVVAIFGALGARAQPGKKPLKPLSQAIEAGNIEAVKLLISQRANVNRDGHF